MKKMYLVYVIGCLDGCKRAVAVSYDSNENILDSNKENVDVDKENVLGMYVVEDETIAEKAVKAYMTNTSQDMGDIIAGLRVYQRLEYVREDTSEETEKLARMDSDTLEMLEEETDSIKLKLAWFRGLMKDLLGDGSYACDMMQVEHHFGQISQDLFDAFVR